MSTLCELIYASFNKEWGDSAFKILTEFAETRYGKRWEKRIQIRVNGNTTEDAAPYAAYIPAGQPKSGPYGGMSFVLCPSPDSPG